MSKPLLDAIVDGDEARVRELLDAEPELLQQRLPVDERLGRAEQCTALHAAVGAGELRIAELLIACGIDLDARNSEGRTPLHDAIEHGAEELIELLLESGAEVDINAAAILGHASRVIELLEYDPELVNDRSTNLSPLGWAAFGDQDEVARDLLARGARMDAGELLCAASVGHVAVARVLLEHGADPDQFDQRAGGTALHAAVSMKYSCDSVELVELLLESGADPMLRTESGMTALELAEFHQLKQCEQLESGEALPLERNFAGVVELLRAFCDARAAGCDEFDDFED
jgi:ankyrin repeat protein